MQMKALILIVLIALPTFAQTTQPSQEFVDDATKAFIELRAQRELNEALKAEREANYKLIDAITENARLEREAKETYKERADALSKIKCEKSSFLFIFRTTKCH
jgi:rubrerythrin